MNYLNQPTLPPPFQLREGQVDFANESVLQSVDLEIVAGSFVAVLGQNGSGKSTLIRALLGLLPLAAGELLIYEQPANEFKEWNRIAYVPQQLLSAGAVPVSVKEVVASALISPRTRFRRPGATDAIKSALQEVDLWQRRNDSMHTLSGGQQRRVMIAAALAKAADVLVLDEPTAGVDAENVAHLVALLATLKQRGVTIIVVTHELGELAEFVTRVIVLGRRAGSSVLYDGPPPRPRSLADPHGHHEGETPHSMWELPK